MNHELLVALAISLALTLIIEVCFFILTGKRNKKDLLLTVAVNVVTNPVVVLMFWLSLYTDWNRVAVMVPLELCAVCTEGYYYKKCGQDFKRPYLFSVAANAVSFIIGVLLQQLI